MNKNIFEQLRIPIATLSPNRTNIAAANGSPLKTMGVAELDFECFCHKPECEGFKKVKVHVILGLSEQVLLSNLHCQQLGLVHIRDDNDKMFRTPKTEHPASFRSLINNLALSYPEQVNLEEDKHECIEKIDLDELSSIAPEIEST